MSSLRTEVARRELVAEASRCLTETVAVQLPFEALGPFKTLLRRFFSGQPWSEEDAAALSDIVTPHVGESAWSHRLDADLTLRHGVHDGRYAITVEGSGSTASDDMWSRVFAGPVYPEPTPHPQKVKFAFGGEPAPGIWYLAGDDAPDWRVRRLLTEPDVSDVMVAGDFVTIGLRRGARWQERLDHFVSVVTQLFETATVADAPMTRDELVTTGRAAHIESTRLHLLDPDDMDHRRRLRSALDDDDARVRRTAVAVLAGSQDPAVAAEAVAVGARDSSLVVRRTAIDAAGDAENEIHRPSLEAGLGDGDAWTRWRSVRALGALGLGTSREVVHCLADDPDFQVRFEVARVERDDPEG